jgi:hypothetical protein
MNRWIAGDKREPIGQFKAFLGERAPVAQATRTERGFMDQLQRQSGLNTGPVPCCPTTEQIPGAQTQVLWNQQPQTDQIAIDLIGQQLTDSAFNAGGVGGLCFGAFFGPLGFDGELSTGTVTMEFFFEGRTVR